MPADVQQCDLIHVVNKTLSSPNVHSKQHSVENKSGDNGWVGAFKSPHSHTESLVPNGHGQYKIKTTKTQNQTQAKTNKEARVWDKEET
jgi:hypothetical protein